ncbi:hypothetical protein ACIA8K_29515 [Catenuloplanes sp. NPDC051500]|uniref:hypothetical protein n=1 Tax=Catenuloplanes sp. NPDC051500 TaxID=3363959 RepID=UPI00379773D6
MQLWFDRCWRIVGREVREAVEGGHSAASFARHGVRVAMHTNAYAGDDHRPWHDYDATVWSEFQDDLGRLWCGSLFAQPMNEYQLPLTMNETAYALAISAVDYPELGGGLIVMNMNAREELLFSSPEAESALLAAFREVVEISRPVFGIVGFGPAANADTGLEEHLRRLAIESLDDSRRLLRGYSWVTVLPPEIAEVLGGRDELVASGAFYGVDPIPGGGLLLQATESWSEYDQDAATRVFEVLQPVLLEGAFASTFDVERMRGCSAALGGPRRAASRPDVRPAARLVGAAVRLRGPIGRRSHRFYRLSPGGGVGQRFRVPPA